MSPLSAFWARSAAIMMMLSVILGAFGAHALKQHLALDALKWWHTGVQYQSMHGLGLFAVAWLAGFTPKAASVGKMMVLGTVLFSGSLYAMAVLNLRWLGAITPVGGLFLIGSWLRLAFILSKTDGVSR